MKWLGGAALGVVTLMLVVVFAGAGAASSSAASCGTFSGAAKPAVQTLPGSVGRWSGEQITIAATLLDAAAELRVNQQAQTILIMTAMGESSLTNLDHGDAVDTSTIGVLQQGASYGPREARMDPGTAAKAFLMRLLQVPGWESLEPTIAAHKVQINADPFHYAPFWSDAQAVVAALSGAATTSGCVPVSASGDAVQLARTLVAAREAGTLTDYQPEMLDELNRIAEGTASPVCGIDVRVLQVLVLALNRYGSVAISDLNRPCVGQDLHCAFSGHCDQPSTAVDFNAIGGRPTTGGDAASLELLAFLDPIVPRGSHAGQVQCRPSQGFTNFGEFSDPCTHLHIDFQNASGPLTLPAS